MLRVKAKEKNNTISSKLNQHEFSNVFNCFVVQYINNKIDDFLTFKVAQSKNTIYLYSNKKLYYIVL